VILVFASELDSLAASAVSAWPGSEALLVTPADLTKRGWSVTVGCPEDATLVAGGERIPARAVAGVITLMPVIVDQELFDVEPEARPYVASEATAFLTYLLTSLPCHVVNRPTALSLAGPNLRPEEWSRAASLCGLPCKSIRRDSKPGKYQTPTTLASLSVVAIGGRIIENAGFPYAEALRRLSSLTKVTYLKATFAESKRGLLFASADARPDLSDAAVCNALREHFRGDVSL
jgi:hypothetical protein